MKKTSLALAMAGLMGAGVSQAAFFDPNATYTVEVTGGCFAFGNCTTGAQNVGTGSFTLSTDGTGAAFTVGSYSGINYTGTPGGLFQTGGTVNGTGTVSDQGQLDLNFTGRTGTAQFFPQYAGAEWNRDNGVASGTGQYEGFTTGTDSNVDPGTGGVSLTLNGQNLAFCPVCQAFTGTLVSVGNVGSAWGAFAGTPYSEVFNIAITGGGAPPEPIPVPAAAWLFGSGLVGLVGVARRRRKSA